MQRFKEFGDSGILSSYHWYVFPQISHYSSPNKILQAAPLLLNTAECFLFKNLCFEYFWVLFALTPVCTVNFTVASVGDVTLYFVANDMYCPGTIDLKLY